MLVCLSRGPWYNSFMKLNEIYKNKNITNEGSIEWVKPVVSFEIFPPETEIKTQHLYSELEILKQYKPEFISLTCGAGGRNNQNTKTILQSINNDFNLNVMPHLTCICTKKEQINEDLQFFKGLGIDNILTLRGDKPQDIDVCYTDFRYANELVDYAKHTADFSVAVAGYPEGHIDCANIHEDIKNLKKKVDAGAEAIFTQMFFDNNKFFNYVHLVREEGIDVPVIPGIMPVISLKQLQKMISLAKICVPKAFLERLEKHSEDSDYIKKLGIDFTSYQCQQLIDTEVPGLHFFTLNKSYSTAQILENVLHDSFKEKTHG